MNTTQLEYFVSVAELHSLKSSAEALCVTDSGYAADSKPGGNSEYYAV